MNALHADAESFGFSKSCSVQEELQMSQRKGTWSITGDWTTPGHMVVTTATGPSGDQENQAVIKNCHIECHQNDSEGYN